MGGFPGCGAPALIADGDAACRARVAGLVECLGFVPYEAATGIEAMQLADRLSPSLVVLEVTLEEITGYEVCRALRERYSDDVRIMFVAGARVEALDRVAGLLIGADDYVVKPFDSDELNARLRSLTRRHNGRPAAAPNGRTNLDVLTPREREVIALLARGRGQNEIAQELFISVKTVATHIQRVLGKLNVHSRAQAVAAYHLAIVADFDAHASVAAADG